MLFRSFFGSFFTLNRIVANNVYQQMSRMVLCNVERQLVTANSSFLKVGSVTVCQQRFKAKRKGKQSKMEEKDQDDDDEEEEAASDVDDVLNLPETIKVDAPSLKIEFVLTRCLFKSRSAFEEAISKQRLRVNGEPVESKDLEVTIGDVFDCVLGRNNDNYDLLDVNRVTIMKLPDKFVKGRAILEVEKCLKLTIADYKKKWEGISVYQQEIKDTRR